LLSALPLRKERTEGKKGLLKDGASFCYYANVLPISGLVRVFRFLKEFAYQYNGIFVRCVAIWKNRFSKGYQNLKRKLGVPTHVSEITELKFRKKMPYILCIAKLFYNHGIIVSENCVVTHILLFRFQ